MRLKLARYSAFFISHTSQNPSPKLGEGARRAGEVCSPPLRKGRLGGVVVIALGVPAEQCPKGG